MIEYILLYNLKIYEVDFVHDEIYPHLPNHMSHAIAHSAKEHWYDAPNRIVNHGFRWVRDRLFRPLMVGVVTARYAVVAAAVVMLASQLAMFITGDVKWRFFNALNADR